VTLAELAAKLSELRTKTARKLAQEVTKELTALAMASATFVVDV